MEVSYLGFAAIFFCIGVGFLFMKKVAKMEAGPGFWAVTFFLNSAGFILWSGVVPLPLWQYFLFGEMLHFSGFLFLLYGVYRFLDNRFKLWNMYVVGSLLMTWLILVLQFRVHPEEVTLLIRILRSLVFLSAGAIILLRMNTGETVGRWLAGISLILWAVYVVVYGFIRIDALRDFIFGLLVGFQVFAAFGLAVMVMDRIRLRAEENERRVTQLEKLLPICSYCKKIRDKNNGWHVIETYIEERTDSQFSHGICPECLGKHFPDYAEKILTKK
jgi:hypothetical protein